MSRPKIEILCQNCNKVFIKDRREYNRRIKNSITTFYCSRSCSTSSSNRIKIIKRTNLLPYNKNRLDEYSPFREILRRCHKRDKEYDIDLIYISELWKQQNGKCSITNVSLILPKSNEKIKHNNNYLASIDRIDSNQGYVKGNIRFVSVTVNYLKNSMTDTQVMEFIEIIKSL